MSFFDSLTQFPVDPILSLPISFAADPRPNKVNLGIGSYRDADGKPIILKAVKQAEREILAEEKNKEYLPIDGDPAFVKATIELIFGKSFEDSINGGIFSAQTVGGTAALRIGGEFLSQEITKTIFLPNPTWPNHKLVFAHCGLKLHNYRYYDENTHHIDFAGMCSDISEMPPGSCILLHACCQNPTGMDLSFDQWQTLSKLIKTQKIIPFFDFAYQGFASNLDEDARSIRYFATQGHEMLVANSYAKNFGLYGERVGALSIIATHKETIRKIASQVRQLIRSNYSTPPAHGSKIVTKILESESLKMDWTEELANMRDRNKEMRHRLISHLQINDSKKDWSFLNRQNGFFSFCGLNPDQVQRLLKDYAIYMPSNGRINVAALNAHNMEYVVNALTGV